MHKENPFAKGAPKGMKPTTIIAIDIKPAKGGGKKAPAAPPKKGSIPKGFVPFAKKSK